VNDCFALDTVTWTWRELAQGQGAKRPSPRAGSAACAVGGKFVISGGAEPPRSDLGLAGLVPRGDVWGLDLLAEGGWQEIVDQEAPNAPAPRNAHTLTHIGEGKLVLHGGWHPFVRTYDDTTALAVTETPTPTAQAA